ncbi:MAG: Transcriptional activator spt7 [Claussenomyces sp. TS43310]|nr:MAG: Transcriptional activator spt7 [Claussenomyces sp. TS43310]
MSFTHNQRPGLTPLTLGSGDSSRTQDERIGPLASLKSSTSTFDDAGVGVSAAVQDGDIISEMEEQRALFKQLFTRSEAKIAVLFGDEDAQEMPPHEDADQTAQLAIEPANAPAAENVPKKLARTIDEDDYDDDEDEDEDSATTSSFKNKSSGPLLSPSKSGSSPVQSELSPSKHSNKDAEKLDGLPSQPKTSDDVRKQLEESKKATEDAVKRSFHTMFYTLENDRVAMLEQQRLEDSEKQIDADLDHGGNGNHNAANGQLQGTLSSANLGASSLTLKHLIARIDLKRDKVKASDAELRSLMNEVRKNRSKWASEENVGQEELYEAAEKVLSELKAMTEYSAPFLTRVNKREAPDYYNIIKQPMDLGAMTKKLRTFLYKSKAEFVADLDLIWSNCLKYNGDLSHPLRRNANAMRKEAEKLIPLIPDIVIRPRAEVEAEERRKQNGDDAGDESDDEPIMSSRGRKAPGKTGAKGSTKARNNAPRREENTPTAEQKPPLPLNGLLANGNDGSEREGSVHGSGTPGSMTPSGLNGLPGVGSQGDAMEIDGPSMQGLSLGHVVGAAADDVQEDEEYKIWKQVTKKDRALVAKERNRLFKGDKLNADEPALLRSRAGMRRWLRQQKQAQPDSILGSKGGMKSRIETSPNQAPETLAEGVEGEEERVLPDYYDALSAIPDITPRLEWVEDDKGQVIDQSEEFLRMVPKGHFTAPQSTLTSRIEANMRQMQETRKVCSKIGVVKQMQLQSQMYNNQFQKYDPEPFIEKDIEPHVTSDDGPIMASWVCRAALQRSVGKLCYHAGFEEVQPSALDVITDIAADYFQKIVKTFSVYREAPRIPATGLAATAGQKWQERFSNEEALLHCLSENGFDVEALESYAKDENERLGNKLGVMHERMKAHLTDLLRPALVDAGADGVGAFNDGSEQFVGGDFAEDLDEDFFGFKELGLDKEFGLSSLSVPLHLLQSKVHNLHQANSANSITATSLLFETLPPLPPVTKENIQSQIGLVKNFFLAKLHANGDEPLVEDEDLPLKQRFPKPRLPPTGKITSPRKRPLKEVGGNAKKKKKLENGASQDLSPEKPGKGGSPEKISVSAKKLKLGSLGSNHGSGALNGSAVLSSQMERVESQGGASQTEKDEGSAVGMMSPESIER